MSSKKNFFHGYAVPMCALLSRMRALERFAFEKGKT